MCHRSDSRAEPVDKSLAEELLRAAWKVGTAEEGEKRLEQLARYLEHDYESAARSLREGIKDMFTSAAHQPSTKSGAPSGLLERACRVSWFIS